MPAFRRILIATDGSAPSRKAVKAGVAFAKSVGASVTAYHALEAIPGYAMGDGGGLVPSAFEALEKQARAEAERHLARVAKAAKAAHVPCEAYITRPGTAYRGIVDAARKKKCGLIFMGSHGRGGFASLILGSVALKVLSHAKVPVVVYR
jgi:nucleotide-binding universal stress UspA family protein